MTPSMAAITIEMFWSSWKPLLMTGIAEMASTEHPMIPTAYITQKLRGT